MSDGPYKSLRMRRWWRRAADMADNENYSDEEVCQARDDAMRRELEQELPKSLLNQLTGLLEDNAQQLPFENHNTREMQQLEDLRSKYAVYPLATEVIDCARTLMAVNRPGIDREHLISLALQLRMDSVLRQIEEHSFREGMFPQRAKKVLDRLGKGSNLTNWNHFAFEAVNGSVCHTNRHKQVQGSLDDGPPLP